MMPINYIKRKFYNKWNYKISLSLKGASIFRLYDCDYIKERLSSYNQEDDIFDWRWEKRVQENRNEAIIVANFLDQWPKDSYIKRIERNILDIYTNDQNFFDAACHEFFSFTRKRFAPNPSTEHLLSNEKRILCKKLPHEKYRYKVFLKAHAIDKEEKIKFLNFLDLNNNNIRISESTKSWFLVTKWNWDRRYILVDDEKALMMLKLRSSAALGSIYEYVIADK